MILPPPLLSGAYKMLPDHICLCILVGLGNYLVHTLDVLILLKITLDIDSFLLNWIFSRKSKLNAVTKITDPPLNRVIF